MKVSRGNRKIGPSDGRVGWGWGSNLADYFPLMASALNAMQLLHDKCAGAPLRLVFFCGRSREKCHALDQLSISDSCEKYVDGLVVFISHPHADL